MRKTVIFILITMILSLCFGGEETFNIYKKIGYSNGGTFGRIKITEDFFIVEIRPYSHGCSFDEFTDENLTQLKIEGYSLKERTKENFWVYIPRKSKVLHIWGINTFGNDARLDLTPFNKYVKARVSRKGFGDDENPQFALLSPVLENNFYRTEELFVTLEGHVSDNLGLYSLLINNEKTSISENGNFKKRIKLKLGKNSILVKVTDLNNNFIEREFFIIRDEIIENNEFSDVDFLSLKAEVNENAIAVVIGIENYRSAPSVNYAVNDADIFREYLIKLFGLKRENIYLKIDELATKGEFEKVFSENGWIARNSNKETDVYIFYAGHGVASTKDKSAYLIPNDIDPNYASTGYSLNELYKNLSKIKSNSTLIILDTCFSGISRENEMLLADSRPISIEVKQSIIPENLIVFNASSGNEISSSYPQKKHGLFTYFFLKGLNKNADTNNDNKITYREMEAYVKKNVSTQARKMGREQIPQLHTPNIDNILLKY